MAEFWAYLILLLCLGIHLALRFYIYRLNSWPLWPVFLIVFLRLVFWWMRHFGGGT